MSTLPVFPCRTETSVYAASDTALYDLDEGATLPAPGGPAWNQMSEAGVQAFTWYDGEFRDEDFGHLTCDMRIWCVHLHETEDPLNNLYLYLNADTGDPVSYTHLDVYKRQVLFRNASHALQSSAPMGQKLYAQSGRTSFPK